MVVVGGKCDHRRGRGVRVWPAHHATFRRLLALLTEAGWVVAQWLTDAWGAYAACLPAAQHHVGKAPMQRLERKHLTLRTRLKRLARRTICFSKKQFFHDGLITLSNEPQASSGKL